MTSVTKFMLKERYSLSLGPKRAQMAVCDGMPCHWVQYENTSRTPPAQPWSQVSIALRTQTPLWDAGPPGLGPCTPPSLPHCGYVCSSSDPACTDSGGLVCTFQTISLANSDHQAQLHDSVRPAPSQIQAHSVHLRFDKDALALGA